MSLNAPVLDHSHYYVDLVIPLVLIVAAGVAAIKWQSLLWTAIALLVLSNLVSTFSFAHYIARFKGTTGIHYGLPLRYQKRILDETAALAPAEGDISITWRVPGFPASYRYLARVHPKLAARQLIFYREGGHITWIYEPARRDELASPVLVIRRDE
jgi:hypothetical protein